MYNTIYYLIDYGIRVYIISKFNRKENILIKELYQNNNYYVCRKIKTVKSFSNILK